MLGKRPTSPTAPMIVATAIGYTPKIRVSVVPKLASRLRCVHSGPRSVYSRRPDVAQHLREANPRRRQAEAPSSDRIRNRGARRPVGRGLPGWPIGDDSQLCVQRFSAASLGHQIHSPLGKQTQSLGCGLVIYRRQSPVPRSGKSGGEGIYTVVFPGVPAKLASALARPKAWAARPPPIRRAANLLGDGLGHRPSPSPNAALRTSRPAFKGTLSRSDPARRKRARGTRPWLRRLRRELDDCCVDY